MDDEITVDEAVSQIKALGDNLILWSGEVEPKYMTTYRRQDGEPILGEYSFVTGIEWFECDDESTELVKETWVLVASEPLTIPGQDLEDDNYEDDIVQADDLHRYSMGG